MLFTRWLFLKFQSSLKGQRFANILDIQQHDNTLQKVFGIKSSNEFSAIASSPHK